MYWEPRQWLNVLLLLLLIMVGLGGITRLTRSGLSITEWKPVTGVIPPLTRADWESEFAKYKATPQYRLINSDMDLTAFKGIYLWEFVHRLWGRLIGLAFALPLMFFWLRGILRGKPLRHLLWCLLLLSAQGGIGWFMVKSGLVDRPMVSHLRLAIHLLAAFTLLAYVFWIRKNFFGRHSTSPAKKQNGGLPRSIILLLFAQVFYGALMAGLRAGYLFPTFPTFSGRWIPVGLWQMDPWWLNFFSNPITVQLVHRLLGTVLMAFALTEVVSAIRKRFISSWALLAFCGLVFLQYVLGIGVVLYFVPLSLAVLHQVVGALLMLAAVAAYRRL